MTTTQRTNESKAMSQRFEFNGEVYLCDEKTLNALRSVRDIPELLALGFQAGQRAGKIVKE